MEQEFDALGLQLFPDCSGDIRILAWQELGAMLQHGNRRSEVGEHRGELESDET